MYGILYYKRFATQLYYRRVGILSTCAFWDSSDKIGAYLQGVLSVIRHVTTYTTRRQEILTYPLLVLTEMYF